MSRRRLITWVPARYTPFTDQPMSGMALSNKNIREADDRPAATPARTPMLNEINDVT